jgi:hypothetical protein
MVVELQKLCYRLVVHRRYVGNSIIDAGIISRLFYPIMCILKTFYLFLKHFQQHLLGGSPWHVGDFDYVFFILGLLPQPSEGWDTVLPSYFFVGLSLINAVIVRGFFLGAVL